MSFFLAHPVFILINKAHNTINILGIYYFCKLIKNVEES